MQTFPAQFSGFCTRAQSDMQSFPSQDLSSLDIFPSASPNPIGPPSQHRLSLGHSPSIPPSSSAWLPGGGEGSSSANGGNGSPVPGWEGATNGIGSREGGGGSRLSAWLRSEQRPLEGLSRWGCNAASLHLTSLCCKKGGKTGFKCQLVPGGRKGGQKGRPLVQAPCTQFGQLHSFCI